MSPEPLDFLLADLDRALADSSRGAKVARLLEDYASSGASDWRSFALFGANYYSRNLIRRSDLYELIVLCWSPGQRSPIHDHAAQRCWMGVLEGRVQETLYRVTEGGQLAVTEGPRREFGTGGVAYIVDDVGWHRIEPIGPAAAVTLHLYSRPIRECRIYDEAEGVLRTKRMAYHSIGGRLLDPVT